MHQIIKKNMKAKKKFFYGEPHHNWWGGGCQILNLCCPYDPDAYWGWGTAG